MSKSNMVSSSAARCDPLSGSVLVKSRPLSIGIGIFIGITIKILLQFELYHGFFRSSTTSWHHNLRFWVTRTRSCHPDPWLALDPAQERWRKASRTRQPASRRPDLNALVTRPVRTLLLPLWRHVGTLPILDLMDFLLQISHPCQMLVYQVIFRNHTQFSSHNFLLQIASRCHTAVAPDRSRKHGTKA